MKPGEKYNMLTAIRKTESRNGKSYWLFKCDCGKEKELYAYNVSSGHVKSCGCLNSKQARINGRKTFIDLTGKKFGKLTALSYCESNGKWLCQCECGNQCFVAQSNLCRKTKGATVSCGCVRSLDAANEKNIVEDTNAGNIINNTALKNSKSGVRGVYLQNGRYNVWISFQHKRYYLGSTKDLEYAIKLRKEAEKRVYGDFIEWYQKEYGKDPQE